MSNQQSNAAGRASANLANAWVRATGHLMNSVVEANRATLAAFGVTDTEDVEPGTPSVSYNREDWVTERTVDHADHISVGDHVKFTKTISEEDVVTFADASGDTNRLHLDPAFAEQTRFGQNIAHGTLVSGLISAALARLPGLTIYLSQDVEFIGPANIGDRLTATVEVAEDLGNNRYLLSTDIHNQEDEQLIEGEAVVLIDDSPNA